MTGRGTISDRLAVIVGAGGFIGRHVVRELARRGWRIRAAVRRPHLAPYLKPMGTVGQIQLVHANLQNPGSLEAALTGADAVVNLVGVLASRPGQSFDQIHAQGATQLARLAHNAGITNFVHISAIGADRASDSAYARSKAAGEAGVLDALPAAKILRPSIIFGARDNFFNRFARMAMISPALPLIGGGHTRFQPVYVDDVAETIIAALEGAGHPGGIYELGGPQIYSFRELMNLLLKTTGRQRLLIPLPFRLAGLIGRAGDIMNLIPLLEAPLTRDQVTLLKSDNIVSHERGHNMAHTNDVNMDEINDPGEIGGFSAFGITPTTLESVLPGYMVRFRKYGQFASDIS